MSIIIVSLKGGEIAILEENAFEQMETLREKLPEDSGIFSVKRIAASTVAAQIIRDALPALKNKTAEAKKKREKGKK